MENALMGIEGKLLLRELSIRTKGGKGCAAILR